MVTWKSLRERTSSSHQSRVTHVYSALLEWVCGLGKEGEDWGLSTLQSQQRSPAQPRRAPHSSTLGSLSDHWKEGVCPHVVPLSPLCDRLVILLELNTPAVDEEHVLKLDR